MTTRSTREAMIELDRAGRALGLAIAETLRPIAVRALQLLDRLTRRLRS